MALKFLLTIADIGRMTKYALKTMVLVAMLFTGALPSRAQSPTTSPTAFTFTYRVNTTPLPAPAKLTATLPKSAVTGYTLTAATASTPLGWLTVTPDSGASPLALTVTVNPTGLSPGSYSGTITIGTFPVSGTTTIPVTLSISNPPSALIVSPPFPVPSYYTPDGSGANASVRFDYTTGQSGTLPLIAVLVVASNGGIVPFSVVAAAGTKAAAWLRINVSNQLPNFQTSGVALSGSYVPINISIDFAALSTLDVGSYPGSITFTNNTTSGATVVNVNLNVSAGAPKVDSIFPASVVAGPAASRVPPVITIYGNNFFSNSSVRLTRDGNIPFPDLPATLLSRKVLQAKVDPSYLTSPGTFTLTVANTKTLADPNPHEDSIAFTAVDSTIPIINSIVNSASYLKTATQTGSAPDPVPASGTGTSVSPREIVTIFGQNLGPSDLTQAQASTGLFPNAYPLQVTAGTTKYEAFFTFGVDPTLVAAPLIMVSSNQINALVPVPPPPLVLTAAGLNARVRVTETNATGASVSTDWLPVTVVPADPGAFTFGGLGLGQAAVLNYDAVAGYSINSAKSPAAKGSTISVYATGMGDLMTGVTVTVTDSSAIQQKDSKTFGLVVSASPPIIAAPGGMAIISPLLPSGVVNVLYTATTLQVQGGTLPLNWFAWGLPAGLSLNTVTGVLSGTPGAAGTTSVTVTVMDSAVPALFATYTSSLTIAPAFAITTSGPLPAGQQYVPYSTPAMQAQGGTPPYKWTASGLPPGLILNSSTGALSGVPTTEVYLPMPDGAVALGAVYLADNTYRVDIDGQPAVTSYAGASQGSVAGLVQVNAIVPPTARTGAAISLTVSIGSAANARRSQLGVTLAVK
jgi:uncharacterized protein (TIGR03437 family)